ncbi:MAG: penicillin-binding protein 2 [Arcobacteraceae bacterium]
MSSKILKNQENNDKTRRIIYLFCFLLLLLVILIISVYNSATKKRRLPSLETTKKELAVRGDVISNDNFKISSSKKVYKAIIDTRFLDLDKKDLFVQLFSIYSDIPAAKIEKKIEESLQKEPGVLVLSYNVDSKTAKNLKELNYKLRKLDVFKALTINGNKMLTALDVVVSGEKRIYSYGNLLSPVIGYISKYESENEKTRVNGIKGLEKSYNDALNNFEDGILKGERDVLSYISFNKNSIIKNKEDGLSLVLNIPLKLQKNIETQLDVYKEKFSADEIIVSVMDSSNGKVLALATSNRFNPEQIGQEDIPNLNVNAVEYLYEPGSVMKPIAISLVMDKNRIKPNEQFFAFNKGSVNSKGEYPKGNYKLGRFTIKDDHEFNKNYLSLDDIVIYSSNIGTLQLAQRLSGREFSDGFKAFGFTQRTGIDLFPEATGYIPEVYKLSAGENRNEDNVYKATVSYGQGMTATFMQLLKAYSVFNNDGFITTPKIVSHVLTNEDKVVQLQREDNKQVITKQSAEKMKKLLIKTVDVGTGGGAKMEGLEIGGKTGTAQIARSGKYQKEYISSFFGFANDKKNKYTIGVTVISPNSTGTHWYYYYAAQSAVPMFNEVVKNLVKLNYLTPEK